MEGKLEGFSGVSETDDLALAWDGDIDDEEMWIDSGLGPSDKVTLGDEREGVIMNN